MGLSSTNDGISKLSTGHLLLHFAFSYCLLHFFYINT
jgi:hypothetical protein